jgi:hypothetical protein
MEDCDIRFSLDMYLALTSGTQINKPCIVLHLVSLYFWFLGQAPQILLLLSQPFFEDLWSGDPSLVVVQVL